MVYEFVALCSTSEPVLVATLNARFAPGTVDAAELCARRTDAAQFFCTIHWPPASFRLLQSAVACSEVANGPTWTRYHVPS